MEQDGRQRKVMAMNALERFGDEFGGRYRDPVTQEAADALIDGIQFGVACMIASAIDAGSERDAVMEDGNLYETIKTLVYDWIEVRSV